MGEVDARGQALVKAAEEAMWAGINVCAPGTPVKAIGEAVYHFGLRTGEGGMTCGRQEFSSKQTPFDVPRQIVAKSGFQVCPSLCGHGIGRHFHTPPMIASFPNDEPWVSCVCIGGWSWTATRLTAGCAHMATTQVMEPGMVFTVEPCVNEGDHRLRVLEDNWTAVTVDGLRSAQFEHTIIITDSVCWACMLGGGGNGQLTLVNLACGQGFEILTKPGTTSESAGTDQDY